MKTTTTTEETDRMKTQTPTIEWFHCRRFHGQKVAEALVTDEDGETFGLRLEASTGTNWTVTEAHTLKLFAALDRGTKSLAVAKRWLREAV